MVMAKQTATVAGQFRFEIQLRKMNKYMNDLTTQKRIIYIILGVAIFGLLGFFLYSFFSPPIEKSSISQKPTTGRIQPVPLTTTGEKPPKELKPSETIETKAGQKLIKITDFSVVSPTINKEGTKLLFYKKDGGGLFSSSFDGTDQQKISNLTILGMTEALWSPTKDRAAIFYLDQEILKGFLHIGTSSVAILPQETRSFAWSPDGKSLAYLLSQDNKINLIVGDSSGKNAKTVFSTPLLDAKINWVSTDRISFQTAPSSLAPGFIFTFFKNSGAFNKVIGPFFGLTSLWSPDGSKVLISTTNSAGKNLKAAVGDLNGKALLDLNIKTMADKCVWLNSNEFYCAVPKNILAETVWPDEYLRGEINPTDLIVYLNLEKKETREIFKEQSFDISDLLVSKNKDYLFFVNRGDGILWALKLK